MIIIRPIKRSDLDSIYELSAFAKSGLTTLPHDKEVLLKRIEESVISFNKNSDQPNGETYFFVSEDLKENKIIGTSAIVSKIGGFLPSWTYEIKTFETHSQTLGVSKEIRYLQLKADHNGPSEIGTLFLHPDYRINQNGRFLSLSRFMFIACFRRAFEDQVLAEMRGVIDEEGKTVFWEALGRHFFDVDFNYADYKTMQDKSFIEELMPKNPIYIPLLPKEAQMVIGQVHPNTRPAQRLLEKEGFTFNGEVDIFEAGPNMEVKTDEIRTVKQACEYKVSEKSLQTKKDNDAKYFIVAKFNRMDEYRTTVTNQIEFEYETVLLKENILEALNINSGDTVKVSPLR